MGWRQQIDQAQEQLFQFDHDLAELDRLLRQFATDSSQLNLPDPVKGFLEGCFSDLDEAVTLLRRIFDTLFLPAVEPAVARKLLDYLKALQAEHQQHVVRPIGPVTQRVLDNYTPPEEHAQYHKSVPTAISDALATDALITELTGSLEAMISTSEDLTAQLAILLGIILLVVGLVGTTVALALLPSPGTAPGIIASTAGAEVTIEGTAAAQVTLAAQIGALVAPYIPALAWGLPSVVLLVAGTVIEVSPQVRKDIQEALDRALNRQPEDDPQNKPAPGGSTDPGPWVDPFPTPRDTGTKQKQPCSKEDFVTFAVKLTPTGSPEYGAQYVSAVIKAHGEAEACFILRELTEIYADPALALGNDAGLIAVQNYLLQGQNSSWFIGAFFEMQWLHDHMAVVSAIEPTRPDGLQGPDAMGLSQWGPAVIDFKSYANTTFTSSWPKLLKQAQDSQRDYPGQAIVFVCDASKPGVGDPARQQELADLFQKNVAAKMPGAIVKITFWMPPNPTGPLSGTTVADPSNQ
jgi:hypothetical protein